MQHVVKYRRASTHRRTGLLHEVSGRLWLQLLHLARVVEARLSLLKLATTVAAFVVFVCILPGLLALYTGIKCWRLFVRWWALKVEYGVEELTGVTVRGVMEDDSDRQTGVETLLLCLSGTPSITYLRKKIQEDILDKKGRDGEILHPNFRRRVVKVCGYYAWAKHESFDISQHVLMAPLHFRGRIITTRNIQEYLGEIISHPLEENLPPWCVQVVTISDGGSEGEGETWIVARAHHLLAAQLNLPNHLVTAYPDPWQSPASRGLTLLSAPASTLRMLRASKIASKTAINMAKDFLKNCWLRWHTKIVLPVQRTLDEAAYLACKSVTQEEFYSIFNRHINVAVVFLSILWKNVHEYKFNLTASVHSYFHTTFVFHGCHSVLSFTIHILWHLSLNCLRLPWTLWKFGKSLQYFMNAISASKEYTIVRDAVIEIYWMMRAFITLPRLVLEELLSIHGVTPLMGWVGRRQRTLSSRGLGRTGGIALNWSDPVPLGAANGVCGVTGATLNEILMSACSGAIRDYLRVTGLPVPDEVCCTVPVHSGHWARSRESAETPGLVTLALPTGAADASSTLHILRKSMEKIRKYPERYLASVWLIRNVVYFLPEALLGVVFRSLSVRYPILMSNLAGPLNFTSIWGSELLNIFYWRTPQSGAVLSICVTSYEGRAHLGVLANRRMVPNTATLPQAFVTHLNELAVDKGIRLVRSWSRGSSPGSTPCHTPPPTPPTMSRKTGFPHWHKPRLTNKLPRRQSSAF